MMEKYQIPPLGGRIIKTAVAVFLCLLIYYLRGYQGKTMPTEAAITAIICMQPFLAGTREFAANRMLGSVIGVAWALFFVLLLYLIPGLSAHPFILYAMMGMGVMASLYSAVLLRKPDASGLAGIVFLCIVAAFPDISNPLMTAIRQILGVFVGTTVAILVNVIRLPRMKRKELVFFVRSKDLVPDRFAKVAPSILFRLNRLHEDGAKICLISEHAPAYFTMQMSTTEVSVPLIVMDGAAIYDVHENTFLHTVTVPVEESARIRASLDAQQISYFIYTVHKNKTCIFHQGEATEEERKIYDQMRKSPYRSYLEGEIYDAGEVIYYKVIGKKEMIQELELKLRKVISSGKLRMVRREQTDVLGVDGLYIYSSAATVSRAEGKMMELLMEKEGKHLMPVRVHLSVPYRTERDAAHLLSLLEQQYEPVKLPWKK